MPGIRWGKFEENLQNHLQAIIFFLSRKHKGFDEQQNVAGICREGNFENWCPHRYRGGACVIKISYLAGRQFGKWQ